MNSLVSYCTAPYSVVSALGNYSPFVATVTMNSGNLSVKLLSEHLDCDKSKFYLVHLFSQTLLVQAVLCYMKL